MQRLGISGTVRASFAAYNTKEEVDGFIAALKRVIPILSWYHDSISHEDFWVANKTLRIEVKWLENGNDEKYEY